MRQPHCGEVPPAKLSHNDVPVVVHLANLSIDRPKYIIKKTSNKKKHMHVPAQGGIRLVGSPFCPHDHHPCSRFHHWSKKSRRLPHWTCWEVFFFLFSLLRVFFSGTAQIKKNAWVYFCFQSIACTLGRWHEVLFSSSQPLFIY